MCAGLVFALTGKELSEKKEKDEDEASIVVYVALCDNEHQGIAPVPVKIGKGDDPENNLYWGCSDGLPKVFKRSAQWREISSKTHNQGSVMREIRYKHTGKDVELLAKAYRGDAMKDCLMEFEKAVSGGNHDLVAFMGHNGLMDMNLGEPPKARKAERKTSVIVLCCKSRDYFSSRLEIMGGRPVLMTKQNMYPGAFLLHDALTEYLGNKNKSDIKQAAAKAYAKNQKISVKAAGGIFADL